MRELIILNRDCDAIEIPSGTKRVLPHLTKVSISQFLGSSYTVIADMGYMCRIDAKDADALGLTPPEEKETVGQVFSEQMVWDELKTVFDPEIPVNIVDLGLIYACDITSLEQGGKKIDVKMSLTAPGCGMASVLKADVETKLSRIPEVKEVAVEVVFEPPWNAGRMSEAAKLQLGFDLDYGTTPGVAG
ncbi:MAG TPA: putative Fe-S cluster assembly protein SufT [Terriglobales bacterium]|jgi:probable FeS assembly SUF system protein SufT